jgi:chromosome partitioning protein
MTHAPVLVFASGKGGTAKTTLTLALADLWARSGARVAVVDVDPQAGLTTAAGCPAPAAPLTAAPVAVHGFTLYPAGRPLADATAADHRARIEAAREVADVVLVDCSPALTDLAHVAAFEAATLVVICARTDAAGLRNVDETTDLATLVGVPVVVVPTLRTATGIAREAEAFLRGRYGDRVTTTAFPVDVRAAEAAGAGAPVTRTAPRSKAAVAAGAIREELAARLAALEVTP